MKAWQILSVGLLVFSCRTEQRGLILNNNSFQFGSLKQPVIYMATFNSEDFALRRTVMVYFYEGNKVLYTVMGNGECSGGRGFLATAVVKNNRLLITPNDKQELDGVKYKLIIKDWEILNDSTLVGEGGIVIKKQPQTEFGFLKYLLENNVKPKEEAKD